MAAQCILLADHHCIVRNGLRLLLQRIFKHATFVETGTSAATIAAARSKRWHLIILALGLPDHDGLDTIARCNGAPILVFTNFSEDQMGVAAIEAGASGYLCKTATDTEILTAVATVLERREYCSPHLRELLAAHRIQGLRHTGFGSLSAREREALHEFDNGFSVKETACHLGLVTSTVSTYRKRILRKLGLRTTNELQRYLAEHRLHPKLP